MRIENHNWYVDSKGRLIVNEKVVSKSKRLFLKIWGWIVVLFFLILGIFIGKWLF